MFSSLTYLQILSVFQQALTLFLCQDTLQLNFLHIFFFFMIHRQRCVAKLLHKDCFVYKLHFYVPVMKYSHPVTRQKPLVADPWLEQDCLPLGSGHAAMSLLCSFSCIYVHLNSQLLSLYRFYVFICMYLSPGSG